MDLLTNFICRFYLFIMCLSFCNSCGPSTHISIGQMALSFFKSAPHSSVDYASILRKHQDAFLAGNPYPDAFYSPVCFNAYFHDVAEDSHWMPFLNVTINYIQKRYPQPWDEETEKLVSFVFGFVSHQISDVTWHSLGIQHGFLRTMAALNFRGNYGKAHTIGDFGGDMLAKYNLDDANVGTSKWYIPVDDLYNIYQEFYHHQRRIPKSIIELCSQLLYIEYILESWGGALIFRPFVEKSPFLLNQFHNFFLGGIYDMASWTTILWDETSYMFEHGTSACAFNENPLFLKCANSSNQNRLFISTAMKKPARNSILLENKYWSLSDVSTRKTKRGMYIYPSKSLKKKLNDKINGINQNELVLDNARLSYSLVLSNSSYAESGRSLALINILNVTYVAVGAPNYGRAGLPQLGCVFLIEEKQLRRFDESKWTLEEASSVTLEGEKRMSKFGWSLTVMLYNNDSYEDLVVGAPVLGADELKYTGKVYIYYGSKYGISTQPNVTLTYDEKSQYSNFGYSLSSCLSTLVIGAPFDKDQKGMIRKINHDGKSVDLFGSSYNSWFGYSSEGRLIKGREVLLIGMPTFRHCLLQNCAFHRLDKQSIGAVDLFIDNKKVLRLFGDTALSEFGTKMSIGKPFGGEEYVLAVSSPGKSVTSRSLYSSKTLHQAGEVNLYNLSSLMTTSSVSIVAKFQGDRMYGRFGEQLRFIDTDNDGNDELVISAPRRTEDSTGFDGGEEGSVYIFKANTMHGEVTDDCHSGDISPCPSEKAWKVFNGKQAHARFGSSFEVVRQVHGKHRIIISAPLMSTSAIHGGGVFAYDL